MASARFFMEIALLLSILKILLNRKNMVTNGTWPVYNNWAANSRFQRGKSVFSKRKSVLFIPVSEETGL